MIAGYGEIRRKSKNQCCVQEGFICLMYDVQEPIVVEE